MLESLSKNTTASWKAPCLVQKSAPFVTASTSFSLKETFSRKNAWKPHVYTLSGSFLCKFRDDCQKNLNLLKKKRKKWWKLKPLSPGQGVMWAEMQS